MAEKVFLTRNIPAGPLERLRQAVDLDVWPGDLPPPRDELLRRVVEGKPILGELVALRPREDAPRFFDVEVLHAGTTTGREGPPQVSTPAYRHGWAEVFGPKKKRAASSALN